MRRDGFADIGFEAAYRLAGKVGFGIEQGERPLFLRELDRGQVGGVPERRHPGLDQLDRLRAAVARARSEEHTSELQSLMRISYAVFCLKKKKNKPTNHTSAYRRDRHTKLQQ